MKRYRRVWVVYCKELLETLRDRRTLAAMILVPIVLYPVLMIIIVEALRAETGRRQAERYHVAVPDELHRAWLRSVLDREDAAMEIDDSKAVPGAPGPSINLEEGPAAFLRARLRSEQVEILVLEPGGSLWDLVAEQSAAAALSVEPPPNPEEAADLTNRRVLILQNDTNPRSEYVAAQLGSILQNEAERIVRQRMSKLPGGVATLSPLVLSSISTSSPEQQFAKILAMVVPFLLVIMTVTGALYPSIDLTAGERERGTLETLAVSPVPVGQIVAGKFGVVVTIAMFSTALNLGSMTAMFHFSKLAQLAAGSAPSTTMLPADTIDSAGAAAEGRLTQRDYHERRRQLETEAKKKTGFIITAAPIVLLAMFPFAVLAGGVMLATCSFARTFKEAQNYMMPVMMAFMIPAMVVSYMPTTRLEGVLLVLPVANIVVLIRELFLGNYQPAAMGICLLSTCFYAAVAMTVAARLYGNEAVLFSDVGSYKTLLRRRFIKPASHPSAATALAAVALAFPFYFYWQSYLVNLDDPPDRIRLVIAGAQLLVMTAPILLLTWFFKLDFRDTFALNRPRALPMVGAVLIAAAIVPVGNFLRAVQYQWFPPGKDLLGDQLLVLQEGSLVSVLLALAVVPAICEELVFRGFLLSGLRGRLSTLATILIVGLIFGLYHMYMEKIPVLTLLGALLAIVCLCSGSIYPAMLIHLANNGLSLATTRYEELGRILLMPSTYDAAITPRYDYPMLAYAVIFLIGLGMVLLTKRTAPHTS